MLSCDILGCFSVLNPVAKDIKKNAKSTSKWACVTSFKSVLKRTLSLELKLIQSGLVCSGKRKTIIHLL